MPAAILHEGKILGVIEADPATDTLTEAHGYPAGAVLVACPVGCNEEWTLHPVYGFLAPEPVIENGEPTRTVF